MSDDVAMDPDDKIAPGGKRTSSQRLMDRQRAFKLHSFGDSYADITKKINKENEEAGRGYTLSVVTIANDVQAFQRELREAWAEERFIGRSKAAQRLAWIIREAMEAWLESKKDRTERYVRRVDKLGVLDEGRGQTRTIPIVGHEEKTQKIIQGRGDPRYLEIIIQAETRLARMAGYDMEPDELDAAANQTIAVSRRTTLDYAKINETIYELAGMTRSAVESGGADPTAAYKDLPASYHPYAQGNGAGMLRFVEEPAKT